MPAYVRPSKQIGLRVPADMHAWLQAEAKQQDRSLPYVIKQILAAEMAREQKAAKKPRPKS
jgi:predicted HicB family RNase H-like nuclease